MPIKPTEDRDVCFCELCAEDFHIAKYGGTNCPKCGQAYVYDEAYRIELSEDQLNTLRENQ